MAVILKTPQIELTGIRISRVPRSKVCSPLLYGKGGAIQPGTTIAMKSVLTNAGQLIHQNPITDNDETSGSESKLLIRGHQKAAPQADLIMQKYR